MSELPVVPKIPAVKVDQKFVQLWQLLFLEPLGVQRRYVPHFKGMIYGKMEQEAQGRESTFTFHHSLLKNAISEGKSAAVQFGLHLIVAKI